MMTVDEAHAMVCGSLVPLGQEVVAVADSLGRVLATPVRARVSHPPAAVSAMDGYAVRAAEATSGAMLKVVGESPAGHPFTGSIPEGACVRIFTGGVVPVGMDSVLIQENTEANTDTGSVTVTEAPHSHANIRAEGGDFAKGDALLHAGDGPLNIRQVSLAAAANHPWLEVRRRPTVHVLATGDELARPGEPLRAGGIINSNSLQIKLMAEQAGALVRDLGSVPDDPKTLREAFNEGLRADVFVTTGGVSVGDHDLVAPTLRELGVEPSFHKLAIRPGKPLLHARHEGCHVLGLPGNPVSAYVTAALFLTPLLHGLQGLEAKPPQRHRAVLRDHVPANGGREHYMRARLGKAPDGRLIAWAEQSQDSANLVVLARAEALLIRPAHAPASKPGETVEVIALDGAVPELLTGP